MSIGDVPDWVEKASSAGSTDFLAASAAGRSPALAPVDPAVRLTDAEVVIVGGGPVGLTAAILLALQGIDVVLFERRGFQGHFPRAHLLNVRTMEIFHEIGVAEDVYAWSPPDGDWHKVVWCTSLAGPTPLHGLRLGEVPAWGGGPDAERYALASPRKFANLAQIRLDRLLWEHADVLCPGRIRAYHEVVDVAIDETDGATVTVHDRDGDAEYQVRTKYVIAADGGRTVAGLLGIDLAGPRQLLDQICFYVTADLSQWATDGVLIHKLLTPEGQGNLSGSLLALGPKSWGRFSEEWQISRARAASTNTDEEVLDEVRRLWGIPADHPLEVHAVSHWQYEGVVAEAFRRGPVFLAGDAAHRHPPTGGLGLNAGVQDAHNLAWKLALVLRGVANGGLLDTYEAERRPVAAHYVAHALENATRHLPVAAALGQKPGQTVEQGWKGIEVWTSEGPEGDRCRAAVAAAIADNAEDFSQLNVEAGFAYNSAAVVPDGTPPPPGHDSATRFTPTCRPGHHVPHVWVHGSSELVSTSDLVAAGGFTLFVAPDQAEQWRAAAEEVERPGLPIHVLSIGPGGDWSDPDGEWADVSGIGNSGAVLVRPDRHVAWRVVATSRPAEELAGVVASLLSGGVSSGDAVAAYLDRMWRAGDELSRTRVRAPQALAVET